MNIYTDGSADNIKGTGGWGVFIEDTSQRISGYEFNTTSNRMEMFALERALKFCKKNFGKHTIYSDSSYCCNGYNVWGQGWEKKNFSGVKNPELWKRIIQLKKSLPNVKVKWVKGHEGTMGNEVANDIAIEARTKHITYNETMLKPAPKFIAKEKETISDLEVQYFEDFLTIKRELRMVKLSYEELKKIKDEINKEGKENS